MSNPELSIVILNYNTKDLLEGCLKSLRRVTKEANFEILVVDNGSDDGSVKFIENFRFQLPNLKLIKNYENLGFAAGNNKAKRYCKGKYVLFLNSDTIVNKNTIKKCLIYMRNNPKVGAMTCKIILPTGGLDKDARRSFITPWIGLVHIFLKLDRIL